ncbi:hypothetical protein Pyrfu_1476 [Pyrolobus fumarii 1A]|uniref:Uncharacterized protein n=1 Tax=Pyrolobus fumarii (strain DSM 11204 / 1A) TaxID=694429 RepID=G0EHB0_PYRF1|nr:hypothetical protein [Pyrolobus fumarii]AEM39334.1 hypothetical protein Pyrfu_1476 [Pyrolobus fumarii 1A]
MPDSLSPLEAAILVAVARGVDDPREIAKLFNTRVEDVEDAIKRLAMRGLLEVEEKRILFLKRRRIRLTGKGLELVPEATRVLEKLANTIRAGIEAVRGAPPSSVDRQEEAYPALPADFAMLVPFLVWMGLLPATLVATASLVQEEVQGSTVEDSGDGEDEGYEVEVEDYSNGDVAGFDEGL